MVCIDRENPVDCVTKEDCSWKELCTVAGACQIDPEAPQCQRNDHCTANQVCSEEGVCETLECLTSVDCEDYQTCSEDSVCVDNPPTIVPRRVDALALLSPNFYVPEIQACTSLTEVVNPMLNSMVSEADENGDYDVSTVFEQVDKVSNTQTGKLHLSLLDCSEGVQNPESPNAPLDVCVEDLAARLATSTHNT